MPHPRLAELVISVPTQPGPFSKPQYRATSLALHPPVPSTSGSPPITDQRQREKLSYAFPLLVSSRTATCKAVPEPQAATCEEETYRPIAISACILMGTRWPRSGDMFCHGFDPRSNAPPQGSGGPSQLSGNRGASAWAIGCGQQKALVLGQGVLPTTNH